MLIGGQEFRIRYILVDTPEVSGGVDPHGEDRNCGDFATHAEAQAFYVAAGGSASDPHRLDRDRDGIGCALQCFYYRFRRRPAT